MRRIDHLPNLGIWFLLYPVWWFVHDLLFFVVMPAPEQGFSFNGVCLIRLPYLTQHSRKTALQDNTDESCMMVYS
jgi:hypothetical protein